MLGVKKRLTILVAALIGSVALVSAGPRATLRPLGLDTHPEVPVEENSVTAIVEFNAQVKRVMNIVRRSAPRNARTRGLSTLIVRESLRQGLDPLFIAAVVKSESSFRASVRSHKDARGLMQITPITEKTLRDKLDLSGIRTESLNDPHYNLRLGIGYLKELEARFKGDRVLALVAYNWGPFHVRQALAGKKQIPGESLSYAAKILENHGRWASPSPSKVG